MQQDKCFHLPKFGASVFICSMWIFEDPARENKNILVFGIQLIDCIEWAEENISNTQKD